MKIYLSLLTLAFSVTSFAFMSGIDPSRDTQGEIDIIGATIPLAPPSATVNAGYVKFTNTSDKDVEFHSFTSPVYDSVEMHVMEFNSGTAKMKQAKMILVPANTPGIKIIRPLQVFGSVDSPEGHAEIELSNVRVPASNILLGEGRGFEIAQGRLGPGRIHHCMRLIGVAQRALELMCKRANQREAFGRNLIKFTSIRQDIAKSECEIQQARLLTLATADKIDKFGAKEAKNLIAMIKIQVPQMACNVVDRAIQIHGGMGVSQDTPLAGYYAMARVLRLADGPDEVHMFQLGRNLAKHYEI